ncbi:MAG: sensor histidine kinase [Acidimicrobiia bacterium]|nr:sensor histidine kinase [Acidimicrobiia bacterium]
MTDPRPSETGPARVPGRAAGSRFGFSPPVVDVAVAIGVLGTSAVNIAAQDASGFSAIPVAGLVMLAAASVALYWRRSLSVGVLAVALFMTVIWSMLGYPGNPVFHTLVSLYAVGRYVREERIGFTAFIVALAVVGLAQALDGDSLAEVATALVATTLPWYVGRRVRIRAAAARERAEHLEWKRATEARQAIADARAGIARELHDVVAHNVSVMTVQAGVARLVVSDDPERAEEAIGAVEDAGRRALDELRHLLGVLRPDTATDELGPQPDLNQIHSLVDQLRRTGMSISLTVDVSAELPVRVNLFAYRIVQEALTNVLKHAGTGAASTVRLQEADGRLQIDVTNTGTGPTTLPGSGHGIVGMRERATLLGGTLEAEPRPEGGFRVLATLPIGDQ